MTLSSYSLVYALLSEQGKIKQIHNKSALISAGIGFIASVSTACFLENEWRSEFNRVNVRQNIALGLTSSVVNITLLRIGLN